MRGFVTTIIIFFTINVNAQRVLDSSWIHGDIKVTIDKPASLKSQRETLVIFYALPNGNSTAQTMGKKMQEGDDWHFDIQHIAAQTTFIRKKLEKKNVVVIYLENNIKSWPAWKRNHSDFRTAIPALIDSLTDAMPGKKKWIYLNGHSGGGSFIFGYLASVEQIPSKVRRISFLDSDYGYDSSYYSKISRWLNEEKGALNVFAYNDSIALYNGKPVVSPAGGTWYRSRLMLSHLRKDFTFNSNSSDSIITWKARERNIQFFFKPNLNRGIYHTQQVELNGFIHSVLCGTKYDSRGYEYYGERAYSAFIE